MHRLLSTATNLFPVWVLGGGLLALWEPRLFTWFNPFIVPGLAVIMLGMGLTLSVADFRAVVRLPRPIATGCLAQFLIMPFLGWATAHALRLDTPLAVGLILVACCPGGTASNVVTYLARANVALSVLMTMCTTFAAIVMTPLLTRWLAGTLIAVDGWGLFRSTLQVVILPVLLGLLANRFAPRVVQLVSPAAPLVSVITIALICSGIIGDSAGAVKSAAGRLLLAVFLLHAAGFLLGYLAARILGYGKIDSRTISIEVGMQNSGLGVVLARTNFPAEPLIAVPCAISSVFHSVIGSVLAGIWRARTPAPAPAPTAEGAFSAAGPPGTC